MTEIKPFSPDFSDAVAALILPIQQQEFGIAITREDQPDLAQIETFYQRGAGNFWIATQGSQVIGTIALLDIGNRQAALRKMFVASSHRGSAHGIANKLLEQLLSWSKERHLQEIYLGTTAAFLAAHRFYEKNGFLEIGRSALPSSFPVMKVDSKFYKRAP
ncbi:GNAT family N-acetyltransferase [Roseateles sp. NT4]|uniref:GNAT family N-acetyltransferase n=1 Tax=Roseateles sp. NT4 TaxID=3453715 RepID=UPI003EF063ED